MNKLFLYIFVFTSTLTNLFSCGCPHFIPGPERVKSELQYADVVFIGKVVDSTLQTRTFEVLQNIKGLENTDRIISKYFDSCSTLYNSGYHIIYGNLEGNALNTSYCSNNQELLMNDYRDVGAYDSILFERMLRSGIENHNFHIKYLKDILVGNKNIGSKYASIINNRDWYRNYTIYDSIYITILGLIIMIILLYKYNSLLISNPTKTLSLLLILSLVFNLLSVLLYSESKPIGIGTDKIEILYGFPKYIYSYQLITLSGACSKNMIHYINFTGNTSVYFIFISLVYCLLKISNHKK